MKSKLCEFIKSAPQNAISIVILLNEGKELYTHPYYHRISYSTSVAKDIRDNFSTVLAHMKGTCNIIVVFIFMYILIIVNFSILLSNYDRFRVKVYMAFSAVNNKMFCQSFFHEICIDYIFLNILNVNTHLS